MTEQREDVRTLGQCWEIRGKTAKDTVDMYLKAIDNWWEDHKNDPVVYYGPKMPPGIVFLLGKQLERVRLVLNPKILEQWCVYLKEA